MNFIDTADVYSKGKSEEMVGELLTGQRDRWVLATKLGNKMSEGPNEAGYSRSWMLRECEASLKRLNTDRIDLYYLHRDYLELTLEEPLRALEALLRDGKNPRVGRVQLSRFSHCRGSAPGAPIQHAGAGGMPAVLQPVEPHAGNGNFARVHSARHRCGAQVLN